MILIVYNPNFVRSEDVQILANALDEAKISVGTITHYSKSALPIYICDGRIEGMKNETNLSNNNETKA